MIRTPDYRLRVFISSTLKELEQERVAVKQAVLQLHLSPVMFELGARPYPPRDLYRAYLEQSHIFIGIYWESYGWIAPDMKISGLEDEFILSENMPRLIYIKSTGNKREDRLVKMLDKLNSAGISYKHFNDANELAGLVENDLLVLLTERFELADKDNPDNQKTVINTPIPIPATPLIGRKKEVADIKQLLLQSDVRMLTLSGPGGIGKTRIALEVARQLKDILADGVGYVSLAPIHDPTIVISTIVKTIFPDRAITIPPLQFLKDELCDKKALLVLDNFEHLIPAAAMVAEILTNCNDLKILITSRELLKLSGEIEYQIRPLKLPKVLVEDGLLENFEDIESSSAVQLFEQRARAIKPGFHLIPENAAAVADICTRLDGIPLAIELAAARSKILAPQAMLPHLGSRLELLNSGTRDMPQRHQTMRATIEWSYELLNAEEQRLLRGLSVFNGGCSMRTAAAVLQLHDNELEPWDFPRSGMFAGKKQKPVNIKIDNGFLQNIESLLSKSLLISNENANGEIRISMFQTISEYASERLEDMGEESLIRNRHLNFFLMGAENVWNYLRDDDANKWFNLLTLELENIRSALQWGSKENPEFALRLAIAMGEYWDTKGMHDEGISHLVYLVETVKDLATETHSTNQLVAIGEMEILRQRFRTGGKENFEELITNILETANTSGNKKIMVDALSFTSMIAAYEGRLDGVKKEAEEGLKILKELDYKMGEINLLQNLGAAYLFNGHAAEAIDYIEKSLTLSKKVGASRWVAISLNSLGFANLQLLKVEAAMTAFKDCLVLCKRIKDMVVIAYPLIGFAQVSVATGKEQEGIVLIGAVERLVKKQGTNIVPAIQNLIEGIKQTAQQKLGNELFDQHLKEGYDMPLDAAIALVAA